MGHWIPVTWLTLGPDYALWGMNPFGYHLGNLLLHAANAALFYLVARRLLDAALPPAGDSARRLGAAPRPRSSRCTRCAPSRWRGSPSGATCSPGCSTCSRSSRT